jgi:hypothetical protein
VFDLPLRKQVQVLTVQITRERIDSKGNLREFDPGPEELKRVNHAWKEEKKKDGVFENR